MLNTKLFNIIAALTRNELKDLRDFIYSPYFNKEKVLNSLADYFLNNYPFNEENKLQKEVVFTYLYPGKKYHDGLMRNILSDMLKLAEKFLVAEKLDKSTLNTKLILLEAIKERNITRNFVKEQKLIEEQIENLKIKDGEYFSKKGEFNRIYHSYLKQTEDKFIHANYIFEENAKNITAAFLIDILFYNTYLINNQQYFSNRKFDLLFSGEIDSFLNGTGKEFLDIPVIFSEYNSFKLLQTGNECYYFNLKDILSNQYMHLSDPSKKDIYTILENYCYKMVTEGKVEFVNEQFLLYKRSVEEGTAKGAKGYISNILFLSIIATGFEAGEFEWTDNFITTCLNETKEEIRYDNLNFAEALRSFWKGEYSSSLISLSKVKSDDFAFKLNIRSLILKIYYELNEWEPFYSHLDSYKHFILNNTNVHHTVRDQVNKFINYSKKLFSFKNRTTSDNTEVIITSRNLKNETGIINKIWLLKKADELIQAQK